MSTREKRVLWGFVAVMTIPYLVQLLIIAHAELWPAVVKETPEYRYEVVVGAAFPKNMYPISGLISIVTGEPCRLETTNLLTGEVTTEWFDLVGDVCVRYPDICDPKEHFR